MGAKRLRPKTYIAAVYLSMAVALIPVLALVSIFWLRHKVKIDTRSPELNALRALNQAAPEKSGIPLPSAKPSAPASGSNTSIPLTLQPTLGAARLPVPNDPARQIADLDLEAFGYMQQGEYDMARVTLLQAENIDPQNLPTLRYQGDLAEAERDWKRAIGYWQRIVDQGAQAGDLAGLAKQHLDASRSRLASVNATAALSAVPASAPAPTSAPVPAPVQTQVATPAPAPAAPAATNVAAQPPVTPAPASPPTATNAPPAPVAAVPAVASDFTGPAFHVSPSEMLTTTGAAIPAGTPNGSLSGFTLRLPIVPANANRVIDPGKVGIKLFFYDQIKGDLLVPTNAHLDVSFEGSHPTWAKGRPEVLHAVYQRPPDVAQSGQVYYGYVFRLYYDGALVEERSNPPTLLALFPVK